MTDAMAETGKIASNRARLLFFMATGLVSAVIGLVLTPSFPEIARGFRLQQSATGLLDLNTFDVVDGAIGVPFLNAGCLFIIVMLCYLVTGTVVDGDAIAAAFMVFGFGFCGKTLWNIWPTFCGVLFHAIIRKKEIRTVMGRAFFSGALSPLVSMITLYLPLSGAPTFVSVHFSAVRLIIAVVAGFLAGLCFSVLCDVLPGKHEGLSLYNGGFAAGLTGFLCYGLMKTLGIAHTENGPFHDYPDINNRALLLAIAVLLVFLLVGGLLFAKKEGRSVKKPAAALYTGKAAEQFGFGATLVNMALCGFLCLLYWALTFRATVHAPFFACLFTVAGFAANGISPRTMWPVMAGVYAASFLLSGAGALLRGTSFLETALSYTGSKNMLIAAIFGCGMAPVVTRYGASAGMFAGVVHSILVPLTGALHGWLSLYNNGFCAGLVVTFFVPAFVYIRNRQDGGKT